MRADVDAERCCTNISLDTDVTNRGINRLRLKAESSDVLLDDAIAIVLREEIRNLSDARATDRAAGSDCHHVLGAKKLVRTGVGDRNKHYLLLSPAPQNASTALLLIARGSDTVSCVRTELARCRDGENCGATLKPHSHSNRDCEH